MKNSYLIRNLGPHLIQDRSLRHRSGGWTTWFHALAFWGTVLGLLSCLGYGVAHAQSGTSDPMVMKIYPDGTKVIVRWSEIGKQMDNGEKFGGAPRIVAYDPAKDGIVPIGQPSQKTETSAPNAVAPEPASVVSPEKPVKMDYTGANPDNFESDMGPLEGFVFRTASGVSFQQPISARTGSGDYKKTVFQPGIRFDLEPAYNVTDWFRVGLESAFIYNQIHSIQALDTTAYHGSPDLGNGGLFQIPILANLTFTYPSEGPFRGFFGGGAGAAWNILQSSGLDPEDLVPETYTSWQWNFVWQVSAGFTYTVAPGLDLELGYKLLSAPNPSAQGSGQTKATYNHTAEIGLAWRF